MRIALGVEYDGSAFSGYQTQPHAPSVQASLESALSRVAAAPVTVRAAGRTDAGVHATTQVVSFDAPERPLTAWTRGTNALTPPALSVIWAREVPSGFDPRRQATARRYMYLFYDDASPSPLLQGYAVPARALDADVMHRAAQALLGEQDFSGFRAAGCQSASPLRCVHAVSVTRMGPLVVMDITANAFLLHMVRNIAGCVREIGEQRQSVDWLGELLAGRDRTLAAPTAPPQGLYLVDVRYPGLDLPGGRPPALLRAVGGLDRF